MEEILIIRKADFVTKEELLDHIAGALGFPAYFGRNLDALFDCLCDLDQRTNIALDPLSTASGDEGAGTADDAEVSAGDNGEVNAAGWYDGVCDTICDAALENENIRVFRVSYYSRVE